MINCKKVFSVLLFLWAISLSLLAQKHRICFYNVENLFDTKHDTLKSDEDFLPDGIHHWTPHKYWRKLHRIAQTIAALSPQEGWPTFIGLAEVENDSVLHDLTKRSTLRAARYEYFLTESPDERGVDVALLYQPRLFKPLSHWSVRVPSVKQGFKPTRDILGVKGILERKDTICLLVVHLPSKAGNKKSGDLNRMLAAQTLSHAIDSLTGQKLLVMGDFNADPRDRIFQHLVPPLHSLMPQKRKELQKPIGTYCYKGIWEFLDHILVSSELWPRIEHRAHVGKWSFLLNERGQPLRTFRGPISQDGYSDHLPIYVDMKSSQ